MIAGAVIALGFWTYQPLKLLPLLAIVWVIWMRARDRERFIGDSVRRWSRAPSRSSSWCRR